MIFLKFFIFHGYIYSVHDFFKFFFFMYTSHIHDFSKILYFSCIYEKYMIFLKFFIFHDFYQKNLIFIINRQFSSLLTKSLSLLTTLEATQEIFTVQASEKGFFQGNLLIASLSLFSSMLKAFIQFLRRFLSK